MRGSVNECFTFHAPVRPVGGLGRQRSEDQKGQTLVQDLTDKCNRCHGADAPEIPRIRGQDRDYLIMALRAYRDDRRESSTMHKMSLPYSDSIIESLASVYAGQPAQ